MRNSIRNSTSFARLTAIALLVATCLLTLSCHSLFAAEPAKVLDAFIVACQRDDQMSADARSAAVALVTQLRANDPQNPAILTEALRSIEPRFAAALTALGQEQTDAAIASLTTFSSSKNPFLAAESRYYLARALLIADRCEEALLCLEELTGPRDPFTLHAADALLLRGKTEAQLLDRAAAQQSLQSFLAKFPNASPADRADAEQELNVLENTTPGSLDDIRDRMRLSQRRLQQGRLDAVTRQEQERIVSLIDQLLANAEEQSQQSASGSGGANPPPGGEPAADSGDGNQAAAAAMESAEDASGSGAGSGRPMAPLASSGAWGKLRDRQRQARALASIKSRFPDRYRQLVEQYYRTLQQPTPR